MNIDANDAMMQQRAKKRTVNGMLMCMQARQLTRCQCIY